MAAWTCLSHIPLVFKVQQDLLGGLAGGQLRGVDGDIRVSGLDIGIGRMGTFLRYWYLLSCHRLYCFHARIRVSPVRWSLWGWAGGCPYQTSVLRRRRPRWIFRCRKDR